MPTEQIIRLCALSTASGFRSEIRCGCNWMSGTSAVLWEVINICWVSTRCQTVCYRGYKGKWEILLLLQVLIVFLKNHITCPLRKTCQGKYIPLEEHSARKIQRQEWLIQAGLGWGRMDRRKDGAVFYPRIPERWELGALVHMFRQREVWRENQMMSSR